MTQQATNDTKITLSDHRLSKDWTVAHIPGTDFDVIIERYQRFDESDSPFRVYVEEELAEARSEALRHLVATEAALPEGERFCQRVEHGGNHPEVDELYDALNAEIAAVKETITREALTAIADLLDPTPGGLQNALDLARHDPRAGCRTCPCSPGVTLGHRLSRNGETVVFNIRRHRPAPTHHLSKAQYEALVAANYQQLIRDEMRYPHRVYSNRGGKATTYGQPTITKLFDLDLIRTGERVGAERPLLLTENGEFELFARS